MKTQYALRTRILVFTGTLITIIMLLSSGAILIGLKSILVNKTKQNAINVSEAFKIPVLNEFIKSETRNYSLQEQLGELVSNFKSQEPDIKFIEVTDNSNRVVAHTDWRKVNSVETDSLSRLINSASKTLTAIYDDASSGATLETVTPLNIYGKRWGVMKIGFDASGLIFKLKELYFLLLISTLLVISGAFAALYFVSGRLTRTLSELVAFLDKLDLDLESAEKKVEITSETEFLYEKFEQMRARLQRSKAELIQAQKQIYQAEKLASIGRLASGVAHEINNPLNGIKSCLYAIEKNPENFERNKEYLNLIDEGINNIELIVKKLLGFARQKSESNEPVNLADTLNKVLSLLDYRLNQKRAEVERECDAKIVVKADEQLLQEVFMNILLNALDAIDEGGKIKVAVNQNGYEAVVEISDNGEGIEKEELNKIFDPFYTTKEPGKGTGLGLSVSLGIIENLNGKIEVESQKNQGTTFRIIIPLKEQISTKNYEPRTKN